VKKAIERPNQVGAVDVVAHLFSFIAEHLVAGSGHRAAHQVSPVSYTHLDVYKRQI